MNKDRLIGALILLAIITGIIVYVRLLHVYALINSLNNSFCGYNSYISHFSLDRLYNSNSFKLSLYL
jgi:hypothetical protein